jgi:hypothetical protein
VLAEHERYTALGMPLGDETVSLEEGETQRVTLRALSNAEIIQQLCNGAPGPGRATLRLTMVDSRTGAPLGALPVWIHWTDPAVDERAGNDRRFPGFRSATDPRGVVTFCDLPDGLELELEIIRANDNTVPVTRFRLGYGEVAARTVRARP